MKGDLKVKEMNRLGEPVRGREPPNEMKCRHPSKHCVIGHCWPYNGPMKVEMGQHWPALARFRNVYRDMGQGQGIPSCCILA